MKTPVYHEAFQKSKCPKCGERDLLRLNTKTLMVECKICKHVWKLNIKGGRT